MSLWQQISQNQGAAIFEQEQIFSYAQLCLAAIARAEGLGVTRQLVLLLADNSYDTLTTYLACLVAKHPVILLSSSLSDDVVLQLIATYHPNWLFRPHHAPVQLTAKQHL